MKNVESILKEIGDSYMKARVKHAPMSSPHEGYAVLLEEFDELWDEVKAWQPPPGPMGSTTETQESRIARWESYDANMRDMRKEALHVAAMSLAFLMEVIPE